MTGRYGSSMAHLRFDNSSGSLTLLTGVTGRAARMGHRLTIRMNQWRVDAEFSGGVPKAATLTVTVAGLEVISGEGGVKGLSGPEKSLARGNALKTLKADRFTTIGYACDDDIQPTDSGYVMHGAATICDVTRAVDVPVTVVTTPGGYELSARLSVRQTDFDVHPYSLMMGSVQVADEVQIVWQASAPPLA